MLYHRPKPVLSLLNYPVLPVAWVSIWLLRSRSTGGHLKLMMPLEILPINRPDWTPLLMDGIIGVSHKTLLKTDTIALAMLKFDTEATIHEHSAPMDVEVICLEGAGFTSVSGESAPIRAGERVRWPSEKPHRLWTGDSEMITLMVEHY